MMIKVFVLIFASVILRNEGCTRPLRSPAQLEKQPRLNQQTSQNIFPDYYFPEPLGQTTSGNNPTPTQQQIGPIPENMITSPTRITKTPEEFSDDGEEMTPVNRRSYISDSARNPDLMYLPSMNPRNRNADPSISGSRPFRRTNSHPDSVSAKLDKTPDTPNSSTLGNLMNLWRATPSLSTLSRSLSTSPTSSSPPTTSTLVGLASSLAPVLLSNLLTSPSNNTLFNTRSPSSSSYDFMSYIPGLMSAAKTVVPLLSSYGRSIPAESTNSNLYTAPLEFLSSLPGSSLFGLNKSTRNSNTNNENEGVRRGRRQHRNDLDFRSNVYQEKKNDHNQGDEYVNSRRGRKNRNARGIHSNENQNGMEDDRKYNYRYEYKSPPGGASFKTSLSSNMNNGVNKYRYKYDNDYVSIDNQL